MKIFNKRVGFDYILLEKLEAGIVLNGKEAKAIKNGQIDLTHAYVKVMNGEAYLINANINADLGELSQTRSRKLLLHRSEVYSIEAKSKQKNLTIVPTKVYTKGPLIKLEIALAKSKKKFEKRESIKKKDLTRDIERELKI